MKLSAFLIRLNAGIAARNAFLETRTDLLRKRSRMIRFEGNISLYISELALVTFTVIKHTSEWYLASFREHDMASGMCTGLYSVFCAVLIRLRCSGMVNWAKEQIENYATMFQKQVYGPDVDSRTIQESIQVTRLQSKRVRINQISFVSVHSSLLWGTSALARHWSRFLVPTGHFTRRATNSSDCTPI